jgi:DNA-binding winged helix-turn-helix (wHTH) protein
LLYLVQNPNRLVTKEELLQAVWGSTFVEEGNLTQYISHVRRALGDSTDDTGLIATIARKGYQFTARVAIEELKEPAEQSATPISTAATVAPAGASPEPIATSSKHWRHAAGCRYRALRDGRLLFVAALSQRSVATVGKGNARRLAV